MYVSFGKLRICRGFAPGQPWYNGIGQKPL